MSVLPLVLVLELVVVVVDVLVDDEAELEPGTRATANSVQRPKDALEEVRRAG